MKYFSRTRWSIVVSLLILGGCFGYPKIKVSMIEGMPPKFAWQGPGKWSESPRSLYEFVVIKPKPGDHKFEDIFGSDSRTNPNVIWRIETVEGGIRFPEAPVITYGQVPVGWRQTVPASQSAPTLTEGPIYFAGQPFTAQDAVLSFKLKSGVAVLNE